MSAINIAYYLQTGKLYRVCREKCILLKTIVLSSKIDAKTQATASYGICKRNHVLLNNALILLSSQKALQSGITQGENQLYRVKSCWMSQSDESRLLGNSL